jgi:antitoxin component YwqK of YwqJK toxin-antitoxin module
MSEHTTSMNPAVKKALAAIIILGAIAGMGYQYFMAENVKTELYPSGNTRSITNMIGQNPHGKTTFYFDNASKNKSTVFTYANGIKSGASSTYHENGSKASTVNYSNGVKQGVEAVYSTQGQKVEDALFADGVKGKVLRWDYHNRYAKNFQREFLNGVQINEMLSWHPNGKKKSTVSFENGKKQGVETIWHDNATKSADSIYDDGIQNGETTQWNDQGEKTLIGTFDNGKLTTATEWTYHANKAIASVNGMFNGINHGEETTFYDTAEKSSQGEYVSGNKEGIHTLWHQDGKVKQTQNYKLNKLNGKAHTFNESGKLLEDAMYSHGVKGKSIKWTYNADDTLLFKRLYNNDVLHGLALSYHPNNNKHKELNYTKGELNGSVQRWNDQNSILEQSEYVNGQRGVAVEWTYNASNQMVSKTNLVGNNKEGVETKWHDNAVKSSSVNYTDNKKNGVQITWFDNKTKKSEGLYTSGQREGKHSIWHTNGQQSAQENFVNNRFEGLQTYWDDKGLKTKELEKAGRISTRHTLFVDGKKHGVETLKYEDGTRKQSHIYKNGDSIDVSNWYDEEGETVRRKNYQNKILLSDISYSKGGYHGKTKVYYPTGQLEREVDYINNERSGKETYYYNDGTKEFEANYKADVLDGTFINYYKSGKIQKSTAYKDGTEHGLKQVFYKSGALHNELTFKDGEKDGKVIWYYENGALDQVIYFENGARNDDKVEVYIQTATGSLSIDSWIAANNPASKHSKGMTGWVLSKLDDGSMAWLAHYTNGTLNGLNVGFHTNGYKKQEANWKNSSAMHTKDLNGKLTDWHKNGNKKYEAYYKSNPDGKGKYINDSNYRNKSGQYYTSNSYGAYLHGVQTYFNEDGSLSTVLNYVNNQKTGLYTTFHTNGYKKREMTWKNGSSEHTKYLNGKLTDWHKNGNKKYEAYYKSNPDGKGKYINDSNYRNRSGQYYKTNSYGAFFHGAQTYFNANGRPTKKVIWKNNMAQ